LEEDAMKAPSAFKDHAAGDITPTVLAIGPQSELFAIVLRLLASPAA
jgi:hypothetical protein